MLPGENTGDPEIRRILDAEWLSTFYGANHEEAMADRMYDWLREPTEWTNYEELRAEITRRHNRDTPTDLIAARVEDDRTRLTLEQFRYH